MTAHDIQRSELAHKTKLTAVRIGHGRNTLQFFAVLYHDKNGNAILPVETLNKALDKLNVQRGQTWWNG